MAVILPQFVAFDSRDRQKSYKPYRLMPDALLFYLFCSTNLGAIQ